MRKLFLAIALVAVALFAAGPASAVGSFGAKLDYLNSDALGTHPGVGAQLGLSDAFAIDLGYFANRSEVYKFNFGPTLYSHDLFGRLLFNTDFDPAVRVGVNVDIANSVYGEVGYEWLYDRDGKEFYAVDEGKVILTVGLRWSKSEPSQ